MFSSFVTFMKRITPRFIKELVGVLNPKNRVRYISRREAVINYIKNRHLKYKIISIKEVKQEYKESDTIFILGGSESINNVTKPQWDRISKHDSFAMNWWPVHPFVPTFYYTNYPRQKEFRIKLQEAIAKRKKDYANTVFFVSKNRAVKRGMHPRILPEFFSEKPVCCFYKYPRVINKKKDEDFTEGDFKKTLYYRGGLSLLLELIRQLDYKEIVLMGVDLVNNVHFYDYYPSMQWMVKTGYTRPVEEKIKTLPGTMFPKANRNKTLEEYLYAVNELYFEKNDIKLSVGSKKSRLLKKIPYYDFSQGAAYE